MGAKVALTSLAVNSDAGVKFKTAVLRSGAFVVGLSAEMQEAALVLQVRQDSLKRVQDFLGLELPASRGRIMVGGSLDIVPKAYHVIFDDIKVWDNLCHEKAMHANLNLQLRMNHVPGDRLLHLRHDIDTGVAHLSWLLGPLVGLEVSGSFVPEQEA